MPWKRYNFNLSKSEFREGFAPSYWEPLNLRPILFGEPFTVTHDALCPRAGYTYSSHNDILDPLANLLEEICFDVEIDLYLRDLSK